MRVTPVWEQFINFKFQFIVLFKSAQLGNDHLCHSERSRTKCGEVEESVLFALFLGDGSFDSLRSLRMTWWVLTVR